MKLSINELRPLIGSADHIHTHLSTLQFVEELDLSNGGIVDDQIVDLLQFISLSKAPVALRSVDLGHNRLGDVGAMALARLLQANADKLPKLQALDHFENSIRDAGALALVGAVQEAALEGNLPLLTSLSLHDNDISETVLRSIDDIWKQIPLARVVDWAGVTLPAESSSVGFGELLKREMEIAKPKPIAVMCSRRSWNH